MSAMFERFDEAELLALIEDELDSDRAEALRTSLRDTDPRALEAIERMRADREILSSLNTPEVGVPATIVSSWMATDPPKVFPRYPSEAVSLAIWVGGLLPDAGFSNT